MESHAVDYLMNQNKASESEQAVARESEQVPCKPEQAVPHESTWPVPRESEHGQYLVNQNMASTS